MKIIRVLCCIAACTLLPGFNARANVYATDIKVDGSLHTVTVPGTSPLTITYRLNQPATQGVTVGIWQTGTEVATIVGGTSMGSNSVVWGFTNNSGAPLITGTFSITITAGATGFTNWQQISVDTNAGNYAFDPNGIAVDDNTNSPYYGRVALGCSFANGTAANPISNEIIQDGIYKMNADGSFADEGGFGYGGYTMDDGGHVGATEMPTDTGVVPWKLRIGDDDRIYMLDYSDYGAIIAFDIQVTTNQIVIDDGGALGGALGGPHSYAGNPYLSILTYGVNNFDVTAAGTSNAAVWLCNSDYPNWGIWMYHVTNGASDPTDIGTQVVTTTDASHTSDLSLVSSGGCTVDSKLDIFCGQTRLGEDPVYNVMEFTNWNHGVLPGASGSTNETLGSFAGQVAWGFGCGVGTVCGNDPTFEAVEDIVVNSRANPTIVACPTGAGTDDTSGSGIRLLNATNGSIVLTNLDFNQQYTCAAWDNVGNLYAASTTRNVWRAWSPPGASTNTTTAVAQVIISAAPPTIEITSITVVPTGQGCATVTINFTGPGVLPTFESYRIVGSSTLNGTYTQVTNAVISGAGTFQATFPNCSTQYYKVDLFSAQ